jgi:hypothetical protein
MPGSCLSPCPSSRSFSTGFNTFPANSYLTIYRTHPLTLEENPQGKALSCSRTRSPRTLGDRPLRDQSLVGRTPERGPDACKQSTLGGFVPPWNRSFSMETGGEQSSVWRIIIETRIMIETGITPPRLPALAERENGERKRCLSSLLSVPCTQPAPLTRPRAHGCAAHPGTTPSAKSPITLPPGNLVRIVRTFERFREPIFRPPGTVPCAPWLCTPRLSRRLFSCCCSPPFLPRGNLVRIVRTFEPFREPIFLPPDTVLRADAAMGRIQKVSRTELIL